MYIELSSDRVCDVTASALEDANVPQRYWEASFRRLLDDHPDQIDVVGKVFGAMTDKFNSGSGLRVFGPSDSGKTYFAVAVLKEAIRRGGTVCFLSSSDVISAAKHELFSEAGEDIMDRIKRSNVLLLDGLGRESYQNSAPGRKTLLSLLSSIYDRKGGLIVTTTLSANAMHQIYGDDLFGKIEQMTSPVRFGGGHG